MAEINRKLEEENVRLRDIIDEGRPTTENNLFGQENGPIAKYMEQTPDENRKLLDFVAWQKHEQAVSPPETSKDEIYSLDAKENEEMRSSGIPPPSRYSYLYGLPHR